MGPSQHLDPCHLGAITCHGSMIMPIGANQIRQDFGVTRVRLRPGDVVAIPIATDRQRVDREHSIAGSDQGLDPHASLGLDPHHHLGGIVGVFSEHRVEPGDAVEALG
jgi:hypothetical protein